MLNPLLQELRLIDRLLFTSINDIQTALADVTHEQSITELGFDIQDVFRAYQNNEVFMLTKNTFNSRIQIGDTDKTAVILTRWLDAGLKLEWASDNFKWLPMRTASKGDAPPPSAPLFHRFCINLHNAEYKNKLVPLLRRITGYENFSDLDAREAWCVQYYTPLKWAIPEQIPDLPGNPEPMSGIKAAIQQTKKKYPFWSDTVLVALKDYGRSYIFHEPSWRVFLSELYELYPTLERPAVGTFFKALANIHATGWTEIMQNLGNYRELHTYIKPVVIVLLDMHYPLHIIEDCTNDTVENNITKLEWFGASLTAEDLARTSDTTIYALCADIKLYQGLVTAFNQLNRDLRPSWLVKTLIKTYKEAEEIATDKEALPGIWGLQVLKNIKTTCGQFITAPPKEVSL